MWVSIILKLFFLSPATYASDDAQSILNQILANHECSVALTDIKEHRLRGRTDPSKKNPWGMPVVSIAQTPGHAGEPNVDLDQIIPEPVASAVQKEPAFLPFWRFFALLDSSRTDWTVAEIDGMPVIRAQIESPDIESVEFRILQKGLKVHSYFGEWPEVNAMKVRVNLHTDDLFKKTQSEFIRSAIFHAQEARGKVSHEKYQDPQYDTSVRPSSSGLTITFFDLFSELDNVEVFGRALGFADRLYMLFGDDIDGLDR